MKRNLMFSIAILVLMVFIFSVSVAPAMAADAKTKTVKEVKKDAKAAKKEAKKAKKEAKKTEKKAKKEVKKDAKIEKKETKKVEKAAGTPAQKALAILNSGDVKQIKEINGISKSLAEAIVEHTKKKKLTSLQGLLDVEVTNKKGETKFKFKTKKGAESKTFGTTREKILFQFSDKKLDINKATVEELVFVNGISKGIAEGIVAGRPYKKIEDLLKIQIDGKSKGKVVKKTPFANKKGEGNKKYTDSIMKLEVK